MSDNPCKNSILVIDDTLANLRLLTDMLRQHDYEVRAVRSPELGLNTAREALPDLVLLDINMPEMDGYEVCRRLKADAGTRQIPIIFLSALGEVLDKVTAFAVGGVDYITKPFELEEVLARIQNQLTTRRLQDELEQARQAAEQARQAAEKARATADRANHAKSQFLANMSHEIRTPMNAIIGYAQILAADPELNDNQRRSVETIKSGGDHLLSLINDVLDLAKIEAGREELHLDDFDLGKQLQDLSDLFDLRCAQKGLAWSMQTELSQAEVYGDENKLRQVLINLLGNAAKFTASGRVELQVESQTGDHYRFAVRDTGPGIDPREQGRIFEPFGQEGEEAHSGGTGLGLTIARRHVEMMGGQLRLQSELGEGALFFFELHLPPARALLASAESWTQVTRLAPGVEIAALVVDDVGTNRDILAQMLTRIGVEVRQADGGAQALAQLAVAMPDIVFLDIRMPDLDGTEVLARAKGQYGDQRAKFVAVSASVLEHQRREYVEAGFDDFIAKPLRDAEVYACLAELLNAAYECEQEAEESALDWSAIAVPEALWSELERALKTQNITALHEHIDTLAELDPRHEPLAEHMRQLCQQFDMKALRTLLEQMRGDAGAGN